MQRLIILIIQLVILTFLIIWNYQLYVDNARLRQDVIRDHIQMLELTDPRTIEARTIDRALGLPFGPDNYVRNPRMAAED